MPGLVRLQSDLVRTGAFAYQFLAENGTAYLTQNVSGNFARVGFGFHYRAEDWTEQPTYGTLVRQNRLMTSPTTPAPSVITKSSEHASFPAWKAFDGGTAGGWWTGGEPSWIAYDHGSPIPVKTYKIRAFTEGTYKSHVPNNFQLQSSTDGVNWVTVDTQTNRNPSGNNTPSTSADDKNITMAQTYVYRHWRLYVTDTPSNSVGVGDLELWGGAITIPVLPIAQVCATDGTVRATLQLHSQTHCLQVVNAAGVLLAETTRAFEPDNWYYLEWSHSLTGGELRFNGVTEITWSNAVTTVEQLRLGLVTTKTAGVFMDDIIVSSGTDWPGPVRCHLLQPNEDIEETGWSRLPADAPTAHSMLTDADDASYLYSQQGVIRVGLEDLPDPNEILAVQVMSRMSVDAEGQTDIDLLLDETIVDTQALTTTPTWYTHVAPVNPATNAAWTAGEVNTLDVGWMVVVVPDAPTNLAVLQGQPGVDGSPQDKVQAMTSSSAPSPQVASHSSLYNPGYEGWKAFDKSSDTWFNSAYALPTPQWIQLDFGTQTEIGSYAVTKLHLTGPDYAPKNFYLSGSNDGSNWVVLNSQSNQTNWVDIRREYTLAAPANYRYYRLTVTANADTHVDVPIQELELFSPATAGTPEIAGGDPANFDVTFDPPTFTGGADIIEYEVEVSSPDTGIEFMPAMTANNAPAPYVASASGMLVANTYEPWKAFDEVYVPADPINQTIGWYSQDSAPPWWLKIDLGTQRKIVGFYWSKTMTTHQYAIDHFPKAWELQGSNNNSAWTTIHSETAYAMSGTGFDMYVPVSTPGSYRYYRWWITDCQAADMTHVGIDEIRLVEEAESILETQIGASSPITFLAKPYDVTYDVRVRARNLKGWSDWSSPISYTHLSL